MIKLRGALLACAIVAAPALGHGNHTHLVAPEDASAETAGEREWLAGDYHIHSEFSAAYQPVPDNPDAVPTPLFGATSASRSRRTPSWR